MAGKQEHMRQDGRRLEKNDQVLVTIEDFTRDGEGIGHAEGYTLFVRGAVIGDRVRAVITRPKKGYAYAKALEILTPSPDRVAAACPDARRCGGCVLQEYAYPAQLAWKRHYVEDVLRRIGGFTEGAGSRFAPVPVRPVIGMEEPFRYRNKVQYPVAEVKTADGGTEIRAGYYAGRSHTLIPVDDCIISDEVNAGIVREVLSHMKRHHILAYDEESGSGLVRHIVIRKGFASGEVLVCLVLNGRALPAAEELCECLTGRCGVNSVSINVNTKRGNRILGDDLLPLYGDPWIEDRIGDLNFRISPMSFYQVNPVQTERLYGEALRAAALSGKETVYDLYCGIGTIGLFMARQAREVYGIEIVPEAIEDARRNAAENGIDNAHFYTGAAEEIVPRGEFEPGVPCPHPDVVMLDPPRKGCDPKLIDAVLQLAPERIVYVSCDPGTLARDLRLFAEGRDDVFYRPQYAQPCDMFPMSCHVETVCLLSRKDK